MITVAQLVATLGLDQTKFDKGLEVGRKAAETFATNVSATMRKGLQVALDQTKFNEGLEVGRKAAGNWAANVSTTITKGMTAAAVGGVAVLTTAMAGMAVTAVSVAGQTRKATGEIQAQLRVTADEAEKLGEIGLKVFGNNFGESIGQAVATVGLARQQLKGLAEGELQQVAQNALRVSTVFGVDTRESISAARTLMEQFGLTSQEAFDFIVSGYQRGLDRNGDFLDSVGEYATQFNNGGASAEQFFSVLETGLQGSVLGTDKAADSFKEFRLRILDGSIKTAEGLQQLGLSSDAFVGDLQRGTKTVAEAFQEVVTRLAQIEEPTIRMQAGTALLGTQFEDLGDSAVQALSMTAVTMADLEGASESLGSQYLTIGEIFEVVRRKVSVSLVGVGDGLLDVANRIAPIFIGVIEGMGRGFAPLFDEILQGSETFVTALLDIFGINLGAIASDAGAWGEQTIIQFADGMGRGISAIMRVINMVSDVLISWFMPQSPPRVAPEIDRWGALTMEQWLKGFGSADFSTLGSITDSLEAFFRDVIPADDTKLTGYIQKMREAVAEMVAFASEGGGTAEAMGMLEQKIGAIPDALQRMISAELELVGAHKEVEKAQEGVAKANERVEQAQEGVVEANARVEQAQEGVAKASERVKKAQEGVEEASKALKKAQEGVEQAQEGVNRVTEEYDRILGPLRDELDGLRDELDGVQKQLKKASDPLNDQLEAIDAQRDAIEEQQELAEITEKLKDKSLSDEERRLLILRQQEIAIENQLEAEEQKAKAQEEAIEAQIEAKEQEIEATEEAGRKAIEAEERKVRVAELVVEQAREQVKQAEAVVDKAREQVELAQMVVDKAREQVELAQAVVDKEREKAKEAQAVLQKAQEGEQVAKEQWAVQKAIVEQHREQNTLIDEQATLLEKLKDTNKATGGAGGSSPSAGTLSALAETIKGLPAPEKMIEGMKTADGLVARIASSFASAREQAELFAQKTGPLRDALGELWQRVQPLISGLIVLGTTVATFSILTTVVGWVTALGSAVMTVTTAMGAAGGLSGAIGVVVGLLGGPLTIAIGAIALAVGLFATAWARDWGGIRDKTAVAWQAIQGYWQELQRVIEEVIYPALEAFYLRWVTVWWPQIQDKLLEVWQVIQPILQQMWDWFTVQLIPAIEYLYTKWVMVWWPEIQKKVQEVWDVIKVIFADIKGWFVQLPASAEAGLAGLRTAWATAGATVKSIYDTTIGYVIEKIREFWAWLSGAVFRFNFEVPELPDWMTPHSPIPLHTRWKQFYEWLDGVTFAPLFDTSGMNVANQLPNAVQEQAVSLLPLKGETGGGSPFAPQIVINAHGSADGAGIASAVSAEVGKLREDFIGYIRRERLRGG